MDLGLFYQKEFDDDGLRPFPRKYNTGAKSINTKALNSKRA